MADRPGPPPQLFVVSAARDRDWVHGYLLPELGLPAAAVVTFDDFTPGTPLAAAVEQAITAARYVVLVLTPAFLDDAWSELGELLASHAQVAGGGGMVPLLLEPCQLPLPVEFRVRLDCTSRARWAAEVGRLRQLLDRPEPPAERIPCPYPGLVAFGEDQAELFFGRAAEVETLARRLPRQSRQMVIGPSGSGKTSLVFAGLLPRLAAAGDAGGWLVRSLRPGAAPAKALAEALDGWDGQRPARRLLLVVDQLEELFAQAPAAEQARFLAALGELRRRGGCSLLLTMRADFYPDLMASQLWPLAEGERLELAPLRGDALREAITAPAAAVGVHVEPALVERLLADAAGEPGVLPLLQETMSLLWEQRARRLLTLDAYEHLGGEGRSGLATALATRADAAFAELSPDRQAIARRMLLRLVQLGEGRDDTRRQQPVAALRAATDDPAEFDTTLRHLTRHRLLTLDADRWPHGQDTSRADLAHEALITAWPSFRRWVQEDREGLRIRAQLATTWPSGPSWGATRTRSTAAPGWWPPPTGPSRTRASSAPPRRSSWPPAGPTRPASCRRPEPRRPGRPERPGGCAGRPPPSAWRWWWPSWPPCWPSGRRGRSGRWPGSPPPASWPTRPSSPPRPTRSCPSCSAWPPSTATTPSRAAAASSASWSAAATSGASSPPPRPRWRRSPSAPTAGCWPPAGTAEWSTSGTGPGGPSWPPWARRHRRCRRSRSARTAGRWPPPAATGWSSGTWPARTAPGPSAAAATERPAWPSRPTAAGCWPPAPATGWWCGSSPPAGAPPSRPAAAGSRPWSPPPTVAAC